MSNINEITYDESNVLKKLGPLYHEYSFFGVNNEQLPGIFELNQKSKSPIISAYIALAIAHSRKAATDSVSFMEMFCADGYYAMMASRLGCNQCIGIDDDSQGFFKNAEEIADLLGIHNVDFINRKITPDMELPKADIIANLGGLYHVSNPEEILKLSFEKANKFLIVQNVVSLATTDENYFESPAPGWNWGSRYSVESFDCMIRRLFDKVIVCYFNVLEGNSRLEDRGSVYYLIEK
ncbi:class I SAM-dependent methyltransferase [Deefgea salmonis]|uniref:Class I SAM-dependent methyltransferase n=1 Tax=Deefgea salmonis TaxID=2875502 RepID=A0ABS8BGM5_9NEIS|nr:class I SAM-dependent methyltransferase [Deefgea salmonis]MCB5194782.1 class I SAM-dependent methyltransferase [Deefgea salmonis]